ncbi:MAG: Gx transporter family protein [Coriobacteriia bacterium]|nr:Gx transporter family protein [Coriobacteriia bacterium]
MPSPSDLHIAAQPPLTRDEARWWARVGVLASLALVLCYIETFIPLPIPIPGIKLGLANIAVLVALELLDMKGAAIVAVLKVLAAGFLFGNPLMMLYSAGGTLLAFAVMAALSRIRGLSVVLVAIAGAVMHNIGQVAVASLVLGTPLVWYSAPVLVVAAFATGAVTGFAARYALDCLGESR